MSTTFSSATVEPKRQLALDYWFSILLAMVAFVTAVICVFAPNIYRDPPMPAGNARGTEAVIMAVAVPALLAAMYMAACGSQRARMVWLGTLGYLVYNSAVFSFATAFNPLFLLYVASLSLSFWAIIAVLSRSDVKKASEKFDQKMPVKFFAGYILFITLAFYMMWLKPIFTAMFSEGRPVFLDGTNMLTSPIHVLDLGFALPLCALGAVWLLQRKPWGYFLSGIMLTLTVIETTSIATDQYFGYLNDNSLSIGAVPIFIMLTVIGLIVTVAYFRNIRADAAH